MAPINEKCPKEDIEYDYKNLPTDYDLLRAGNDLAYVEKQCLKFCYYIQKVRGFEVLRMNAEFFKDHNGWIWFYYAHDIFV